MLLQRTAKTRSLGSATLNSMWDMAYNLPLRVSMDRRNWASRRQSCRHLKCLRQPVLSPINRRFAARGFHNLTSLGSSKFNRHISSIFNHLGNSTLGFVSSPQIHCFRFASKTRGQRIKRLCISRPGHERRVRSGSCLAFFGHCSRTKLIRCVDHYLA